MAIFFKTSSSHSLFRAYKCLPLFLILLLGAGGWMTPGAGVASASKVTFGGHLSKTVGFGNDLYVLSDLSFHGQQASRTINFPYPRRWSPASGSTLYLGLSHAPGLVPRLSDLKVELNGSLLKIIPLDQSNSNPTEVAISLDGAKFQEYNNLIIRVTQHYANECEDPFSTTLWTNVSTTSRLVLNYQEQTLIPDLHGWPYPFFDVRGLGNTQIGFALPETPEMETVRAIAKVATNLGAIADYRPVEVVAQQDKAGALIAIGTAGENQLIAQLGEHLPLPLKSGQFLDAGGQPLGPEIGVLEILANPNDPQSPLLVVSGNGPQGVEAAARALTERTYEPILGGQVAIIRKLNDFPRIDSSLGSPASPGVVPTPKTCTLQDLGYLTTTVHGIEPEPIVVVLHEFPGVKPIGQSQKLRVVFAYGAQMNTELSSLEVKLNDVSLRSYPLVKAEGEEHHEDVIEIPNHLIKPYNEFEFAFHLYPKQLGKCMPVVDKQLWGTLYETTRLELDKEYQSQLPDLSLLGYSGFPLTKDNGFSGLAIVLPCKADKFCLAGLLKLACQIGIWGQELGAYPYIPYDVYFDNNLPRLVQTSRHLLVLSPCHTNVLEEKLGSALALQKHGATIKLWQTSPQAPRLFEQAHAYLEEILSPWAAGKVILVVSSNSPDTLGSAVDLLCKPTLRAQLSGNLASVSPLHIVKAAQTLPKTTVSKIAPWRQATAFLADVPWAAPVILLVLLCFVTWGAMIYVGTKGKRTSSN
ncbi:MAG: cellulose biosynthesis cyclic di-GMP-binding regulatory protein BcsB [Candidatus Melainabacteria bacterium]|nr:cellulose biosynthesis cyclic di-GMP-binding regulatory protein BcsB [Candidatus Melainabacteria bacterium]